MHRLTLATTAAALLAACGASDTSGAAKPEGAPEARAPVTRATTGAEQLAGTEAEPARVEHGGAILSVYVSGPSPGVPSEPGGRAFQAEIVVVNEGDAPADVGDARARFEAWRGDDRIDCGTFDLGGPVAIAPHGAHVYRATADCDVSPDSRAEIRAYLDFGASSGELRREIHHVGRRDVYPGE